MNLQLIVTVVLVSLPVLIVGGFVLFFKLWAQSEAQAHARRVR